jgi:elongation factor G
VEGNEPLKKVAEEPFCAVVWKTAIDPFVGRLSYLRILCGNFGSVKHEKLAHAAFPQGKEQKPTKSAVSGDIVTVAKIEGLTVGDTLCAPSGTSASPRA